VKYDHHIHHRRSIRLRDYDYRAAGAYFVTVCTHERQCIFEDAELKSVAEEVWRAVVGACGGFIDDFIVMPNHVHGIIWIPHPTTVGARQPQRSYSARRSSTLLVPQTVHPVASPLRTAVGPPSGSLGAIVGSFKSATAKRINNLRSTPGNPVWQRNYYEHIIRDEDDLARIRQYIRDNPAKWADDPENPTVVGARQP
jgi:REP-associated tyrosine transposase